VLRITLPRICAAGLISMVAMVYLPFLGNPLVFDDFNLINDTGFLDYTFQFLLAPRWLPYATLAHTYVLADSSVYAMRWGNLALHAANAIAIFVLLREIGVAAISSDGGTKDQNSRLLVGALLAAAMFAVHPVATYGVGYLVQRTILMSTLFMLLMLITYLRWLTTGRSALWVWSAVWYLLSVFSKEHSVMAPAVALSLTLVIQRPSLLLARRLALPFAVYAIIALLVISMVKGVLGAAYEPYALDTIKTLQGIDELPPPSYLLSVLTQSYLYFKYLFLWIFPNVNWMSLDLREPLALSLVSWPYWAAALAFILYPLFALGMTMRGGGVGVAGWVLAYPWLMFAPELSTIRVQEPFVLYRAYLWLPVFGALLPAVVLYRFNARIVVVLGLTIVCALVPLSWNRLHTMSDTLLLWEDAAKLLVRGDEPGAGRIYYNRAAALSAKGRNKEALADMDRVVKLHPVFAPVFYARAKIKFDLKRYSEAEQDLSTSIVLDPNSASVYFARAVTLKRLGREKDALQDMQKSCDMKDVIACFAVQQEGKAGVKAP
jgi:tetratricopeptide (TPR) repeat protein